MKTKARQRAHIYAMQYIMRVAEYPIPRNRDRHVEARAVGRGQRPPQACVHCCFDPAASWDPQASHTCDNCNRRNMPRNGGVKRFLYYLHTGDVRVRVCKNFFTNTFGLGRRSCKEMRTHCEVAVLPPTAFSWGGSTQKGKEALVRRYIDTMPRHYSHYTTSSTNEHVDCASSALNWWMGPLEKNANGTLSPPFLEWLDAELNTDHVTFYKQHGHYPGVNPGRDKIPHALTLPGAPPVPVPRVSYHYFLSVVTKYKTRFKDLPGDQCATCNKARAEIKGAAPAEQPPLLDAWESHRKHADKGYVHRAKRKEECKEMWGNTNLPPATVTDFPPPLAVVGIGTHGDKFDFTECEMGGGLRRSKQGPSVIYGRCRPWFITSAAAFEVMWRAGGMSLWESAVRKKFAPSTSCMTPRDRLGRVAAHAGWMAPPRRRGTGSCSHVA